MMDLIDRDELELDTEWSDYYDGYMSYSQSQINGAVEVQAIIIPEGASNGDMIKAMFPNMNIQERNNITLDIKGQTIEFTGMALKEWWDTPYKKEVEE